MIVAADPERFEAAGLGYAEEGGFGVFTVPPEREGDAPRIVRVARSDAGLQFFPQRSSAQKRVLSLLGENDGA